VFFREKRLARRGIKEKEKLHKPLFLLYLCVPFLSSQPFPPASPRLFPDIATPKILVHNTQIFIALEHGESNQKDNPKEEPASYTDYER
jgi:hypothetical protein